MLIDSHCHIDGEKFDADRADVMTRAAAAGVDRMIAVGCDVPTSLRAVALARVEPRVYATAGVHPHEAAVAGPFEDPLRDLLREPRCVAVGECGLDYYYDHSPREVQRDVFARQIRLARDVGKPLVFHVRDAWDDCFAVVDAEGAAQAGGVFHCFTGTRAQADAALARGFYLSIPGVLTFKNPGELHDVVRAAPLDRLLVETDAPYLAPVPHRGKRNEPAFVSLVAAKIAALRAATYDDVARATAENTRRLFGVA